MRRYLSTNMHSMITLYFVFSALIIEPVNGDSGFLQPVYNAITSAKISRGGYEGIVVAINPQVQEDQNIVSRIETIISEFSGFIHSVTRGRIYFKEVRILIPSTWSENSQYVTAVSESFENSDIRIDYPGEDSSFPNINRPYTNKPTFCGSPGFYIHLTPDFVTNDDIADVYGGYNKVLAHEWAHYRWGVFDEYPQPDGQHFYDSSSGQVEAVRCTSAITGTLTTPDGQDCDIPPDGFPGDNCRFFDSRDQSSQMASLMYKQFLEQISEFCDDDEENTDSRILHNAEAPNQHNIQCAMKSVWQVMREHNDFIRSQDQVTLEETMFVRVRQRPTRYVLVIDSSASMHQRLLPLRQAVYIFINEVLIDGEELGVVEFNDNASILKNLTEVTEETRSTLLNDFPSRARGATTIGGGVEKGLNVLDTTDDINTRRGRLIVLTDGEENRDPRIPDIINKTGSVIIHTIAIGKKVDENLESLANRTGGRQFLHQDSSTALFDIFSQFGVDSRGGSAEELVSEYIPLFLNSDGIRTISFVRDNSLRGGINIFVGVVRNNGFILHDPALFEVSLTSPSGATSPAIYESLVSMFIIETSSQEEGIWSLKLENLDSGNPLNVSILVLAETQQDLSNLPITASGFWATSDLNPPQVQTAYVALARGYNPVIDPVVEASVETPEGIRKIKLFDDGIGEDLVKDDGIYSGFLPALDGVGRYSAQFSVRGEGRIVNGARVGVGAAIDPAKGQAEWTVTYEPSGDVQRTITGGSFTCNNIKTCTKSANIYGPYRVNDLRWTKMDSINRTVQLVFTAPGADLMDGTASSYDVRYSTSFPEFRNTFESGISLGTVENDDKPYISEGNPSRPLEARKEELFTIKLPSESEGATYFFALTASDGTFISPPSNVVSVKSRVAAATGRPEKEIKVTEIPTEEPPNLLPILGASLLLLLLLLLVLLLLLLLIRLRKKEKKTEKKIRAVIDDDRFLSSSRLDQETVRRNDVRQNYDDDHDITRGSVLVSVGSVSGAEHRGQGNHDTDSYRTAAQRDLTDGHHMTSKNDFRDALKAAQVERGLDPAREADRMIFPDGGFDHDIAANLRGSPYADQVRSAERQYGFLPGNPHAYNNVREAELLQGSPSHYDFLSANPRQTDALRRAEYIQNGSDYQFLPAEAQQYGDLRMASITYNDKGNGKVMAIASTLDSSLHFNRRNPNV